MQRGERPGIWGGLECSHLGVHDRLRDQIVETGHHSRPEDIDLIAGLGLRTLRYPVLWARIWQGGRPDFRWQDERLARLRAHDIDPIAGFLHHGNGPDGLHPLSPGFAGGLAAHASAVARRYPWLRRFTPINEPVTTARFTYLYGHWQPHLREEAAFLHAVVASAVATSAAMAAIRRHIPGAELVQTEDVGRSFSTPDLAYQTEYENDRRFLGLDLLTGRVIPGHPFYRRLLDAGAARRDLDRLAGEPCPPQIIGIDQYLTSDRFLDSQLERHPRAQHGGNGRHRYADVAAAHVPALHDRLGFLPRLREVHARYGLPVALTEVHNGARPEGQLRWLAEAWQAACTALDEGIPVVAVTSWSLFGCIDWSSLLCRTDGHYEPGAFDIRRSPPRLTAVGRAVASLARDGSFDHPLLTQGDWWRPAHGGAPVLLNVNGPSDLVGPFVNCCAERRIGCDEGRSLPELAKVVISRHTTGVVLRGATPCGRPLLERRMDTPGCFMTHTHAFLDQLIERTVPAA